MKAGLASALAVSLLAMACGGKDAENKRSPSNPTGGQGGSAGTAGGVDRGGGGGSDQGGTAGSSGGTSNKGGTGNNGGDSSAGTGNEGGAGAGCALCNGVCLEVGAAQDNCSVLAQAIGVRYVAVDDAYVYLAMYEGVGRVAKSGGAVEMLSTGAETWAIAVNSTQVFWSTGGFGEPAQLWAMPKAGGQAVELDTHEEDIPAIVASETRVFYFEVHFPEASDVSSVTVAGADPLHHGTSESAFRSLTVDDTSVYWGDNPFAAEMGQLWRSPGGSAAAEPWGEAPRVQLPFVVGDYVYYYDQGLEDSLYRAARASAGATLVGTVPNVRPFNPGFFSNGTAIFYFSDEGVTRVGLDTTNPEVIVTGPVGNWGAADATHLYVTEDDYLLKIEL